MEELNKTQIVLLTLLVSFVTSIATGIVTVTLLEQAPTGVTQTINQVVEKTIERVVPGDTKIVERIKEVETVKTEDDLIIAAVAKSASALVRIVLSEKTDTGEVLVHSQTGFFVNTDGLIVTIDEGIKEGKKYSIAWQGGTGRSAEVVAVDSDNHIAVIRLLPQRDSTQKIIKDAITPIIISKQVPVLGQSVLALGSRDASNPSVSLGIISGVRPESASTTPEFQVTVEVNASNRGGPLLNLRGELVGVLTGAEEGVGKGLATPIGPVTKLLQLIADSISQSAIIGDQTAVVGGTSPILPLIPPPKNP